MGSEKTTEKIEAFWVNATADDVARVMAGETVEARFRDSDRYDWWTHHLAGWKECNQSKWIDSNASSWVNCQVYREPSWYANKPDPGPGYRLLGKFPDEELKPGDDLWLKCNKSWTLSDNAHADRQQDESLWYRRRIDPAEPKFAVGQMVRVVGTKGKPARHWAEAMDDHIGTVCAVRFVPPRDYEGMFYKIGEIAEWAFREDYLEAVEPEPVEAPNTYHYTNPGDVVHCPNGTVIVIGSKGFEVTQ
jgi:hypothetical protein